MKFTATASKIPAAVRFNFAITLRAERTTIVGDTMTVEAFTTGRTVRYVAVTSTTTGERCCLSPLELLNYLARGCAVVA